MTQAATACTTLENVDVECTYCGVRMTSHLGSGKQVRYFYCPSCSRWTSSVYTEVLRADSKMRTRKPNAEAQTSGFGTVKERLDRWLRSLELSDPWKTLGVLPEISDVALRERYLALARQHHPDHGGKAEDMRRINEAYEKVLEQRERRRTAALMRSLPAGR